MDNTQGRLSIKELAAEDRPREKMLINGVSSLSDAELIAILIGSGNSDETSVQLSQRILNGASNSLNKLGKLSVKELMDYKGIGQAKAIAIAAAMELGRRKAASEPLKRESIRSSHDAFLLFYPLLCDIPHEELWVAFTNSASRVIEKTKISQGGLGEASADLRFIMKAAINATCQGIILCHNHPSGNLHPSGHDDSLTARVGEAAKLLGMQLLDHIIISDKHYYSYADEGRL
ncbi:MAG: DNA repair protein RadC [Tannerella sp.]|jgi:DNA repair protein RadC|nr:DNA repair protein RadC [Tannerella sp.]